MAITVLSDDEYKSQEFDAVLVRERTVLCVDDEEGRIRLIPLEKLSHVDADPETMLAAHEVPDWFHGGANCAFVEVEKFPDLEAHLEETDRETF